MNFKELVDSGEYSRDDLDETQNAYIDGLSESVQCAKDLIEMMKEDLNDGTLLSEISAQEKETFVKQFEDYMDTVICQSIVEMADKNDEQNSRQPQRPVQGQPQPNYMNNDVGQNYQNDYPRDDGGYRNQQNIQQPSQDSGRKGRRYSY